MKKNEMYVIFWLFLTGLSSIVGFGGLVARNLWVFSNVEKNWTQTLESLALLDVVGFSLIALGFHIWSILYLNYCAKRDNRKSIQPCPYCGEEDGGHVLCGNCSSVQWNKLGLLQAIAAFTAQHRWQLLTAFFFLFIATPLSFIYTLKKEKEALLESKKELIRKSMDNVNQVRSIVISMESTTNPVVTMEKYQDMVYHYMQFTWEISDRLSWIMENNQLQYPEWKKAHDTISYALKSNKRDDAYHYFKVNDTISPIAIVTFFVEDDIIDFSYTEAFKKYGNALKNAMMNPTNTVLKRARKVAALELVERLKITNAVLSTIILGNYADNVTANRHNREVLLEYCNKDVIELLKAEPNLNADNLQEKYNIWEF